MENRLNEVLKEIDEAPETIRRIQEIDFLHNGDIYVGYQITTSKQYILMGIDADQQCCETSGYLMTNDDLKEFILAEVLSIELVDTALNVEKLNSKLEQIEVGWADDDTQTMFVNINTNKGVLQFVAYNSHNGYYGHRVVVLSKQLNHTEIL